MHYVLRPKETFQHGFNRVAAEELVLAIDLVESGGADADAVHNARKSIKRLRSLLRLARPVLSGEQFRTENARLRDAAASLSAARDAEVMLHTYDRLIASADHKKKLGSEGAAFRDMLQQKREGEAGRLTPEKLTATIDLLREARDSLAHLRFGKPRDGALEAGLAEMIRRGRRAIGTAYHSRDPHAFHDYRKSVQHYHRQMQLLAEAWPQLMRVHIEAAKELADVLGEEHDLSVLHERVLENRKLFADKTAMKHVVGAITARQRLLRRDAQAPGHRLFVAEPPRAFARRIMALFATAG